MDKCWFVLRQTHYPAPEYAHPSMARGEADGPILLGHVVPSPRELDMVINSEGPVPFPRDMRVWATTARDFHLDTSQERGVETRGSAGAPLLAAAGTKTTTEAGLIFRRSMGNAWDIDRLDTQTVQPSLTYLDLCRASSQVAAYVKKKQSFGTWSFYMITGLMIARGATNNHSESSELGGQAGLGLDAPGTVAAEVKAEAFRKQEFNIRGASSTDFIWAVRLTKVSKPPFSAALTQRIVTAGATFAQESERIDISTVLAKEGLKPLKIIQISEGMGEEEDQQFLVLLESAASETGVQ